MLHTSYNIISQCLARKFIVSNTQVIYFFLFSSIFLLFRKNGNANANSAQMRVDSENHNLQEYTYKKITPCDVCSQVLRGEYLDFFKNY